MEEKPKENWGSAGPYERYVGRWSRKVASEFLDWISVPPGKAWADVGCGTGALVESILAKCEPESIVAVDKAEGFVSQARRNHTDPRVSFETADASQLPWDRAKFDATVSGLVLNFVPDYKAVTKEMARVTKPGGKVAAYVWDYGNGMQMMRHFWDAAVAVSPHDAKLDQGERFPICQPEPLQELFQETGLSSVTCRAIEMPTVFLDFEDYWSPFLGKQGAAPSYLASVNDETREKIRALLESRLVPSADGTIALRARAWAVQGTV
jgi:trans-aconitate methyltransferase